MHYLNMKKVLLIPLVIALVITTLGEVQRFFELTGPIEFLRIPGNFLVGIVRALIWFTISDDTSLVDSAYLIPVMNLICYFVPCLIVFTAIEIGRRPSY